jgi:hypothetical protein
VVQTECVKRHARSVRPCQNIRDNGEYRVSVHDTQRAPFRDDE